jgi:HSP20 family protein
MAVSKKKVSRKKQTRKTAKKGATARKKAPVKTRARKSPAKAMGKKKTAAKKATVKKTPVKKPAVKKTPVKKTPVKKPVAKKIRPEAAKTKEEIVVTPTSAEGLVEERMAAPLSEIERMVDRVRDRAEQLRAITNFDPFNPLTFNPMTWEIPSWKEIQHLFEIRVPIVDVIDRERDILVIAEVPGVEKDNIDVTVTNRSVTIKGVRRDESRTDDEEIHRHEIRKGSFSRTLALPEEIDGRKAKAVYKAGVVEMRLPKRRVSKKHNVTLD